MACTAETYIGNKEDGYIYFFSKRQFATKAGNRRRPTRVADSGTWKASGGSKTVRSKKVGGINVGQKLSMVFYKRKFEGDRNPVKTYWGMHEFTKIIPVCKNQDQKGGGRRTGERCCRSVEHVRALHVDDTATATITVTATATAIAGHARIVIVNATTATAIAGPGRIVVGDVAATAAARHGRVIVDDAAATIAASLVGGMMSMSDQANMASTSQASTPSSELLQDWYEYELVHARRLPRDNGSNVVYVGTPVAHCGDPAGADGAADELAGGTTSRRPPPALASTGRRRQLQPPGARRHGGGVQGQHEQQQQQQQQHPQEPQALVVVDCEDGYGAMADGDDAQLGAAEFDPERIAEMVSQIMDGEFAFKFEDDTIVRFNQVFPGDDEVVAAPMLIDGGEDGDGADGDDGDDPFEN
uniref:NAC domain-containing protein n=1 Tax=Oryza punctata TaxID=4537 RepID=A0A0E0JGB9_ORYPU